MKKILAIFIISVLIIGSIPASSPFAASGNGKIAAGAFKGVTHKLKPGVEMLKASDFKSIKSKSDLLGKNQLPSAVSKSFTAGGLSKKIYVSDDWSDTLTISSEKDNDGADRLIIGDPTFLDVFEDINIPEQTVYMTPGNINSLGKEISITNRKLPANTSAGSTGTNSSSKSNSAPPPPSAGGSSYSSSVTPYGFTFKFTDAVFSKKVNGIDVNVKLSGLLDLEAPHIEGKYTKFSGYKMVLKTGETINLKASLNVDIDEDIKIPIGTPFVIPAGVGKASIGLYVILRIDGSIALTFEMNQHFSVEAGVKGGTWFYIPTGIKKVFECKKEFKTNASFMGEVEGILGIAPIVSLRFAGMDVLYLEALLGMKANVKVIGEDVDVRAGVLFKVSGEVMDSNFTLVNYYLELLNYKERYTGKFKVKVTEACAYQGLVSGTVDEPDSSGDYIAYKNGKLTMKVTDDKGKSIEYPNISINNGKFTYKVLLKKGYKVEVKVNPTSSGTPPGYSKPVEATFPFDKIYIDAADYFNKVIQGSISTKAVNVSGAANESIKELAYTGPVKIVFKHINHSNNSNSTYTLNVNAINGKFNADLKNAPAISNLNPESLVYASIEKNGFGLNHDKVGTDGLIFYPFVYSIEKNGEGNVGGENPITYTSKGMKFYVANKRSEEFPQNTPSGDILINLSVAFPHLKPGIPLEIISGNTAEDEDLYAARLEHTKPIFNTLNMIYKQVPLVKVPGRSGVASAAIENISVTVGKNSSDNDGVSALESQVKAYETTDLNNIDSPDLQYNDNLAVDPNDDTSIFNKHDLTHYTYEYEYLPYGMFKETTSQFPYYFSFCKGCIIEKMENQQKMEDLENKADELKSHLDIDIKFNGDSMNNIPGGIMDGIQLNKEIDSVIGSDFSCGNRPA